MVQFRKKILIFSGSLLILSLGFLPGTASALVMFSNGTSYIITVPSGDNIDRYTRGIRAKAPNTPNRFMYAHPNYRNNRKAKPRPECKNHGLSRCMGPKKKKFSNYTRPPYQPKIEIVHPYVRKIHQIKPPKRYN